MEADALIRRARAAAGLTQAGLARRLGTSQPAIAKLERPGANPTVRTLDRVLRATGHQLELSAPTWSSGVDESLIRKLGSPAAPRGQGTEGKRVSVGADRCGPVSGRRGRASSY
jgi:transcriptional regulator with XRE-family HTH domain